MARMTFPGFEEWCDTVLHPEDTHPWDFRTKEFYEEYRGKYAIARMALPYSVLEIGVRFGYGACSFLRAGAAFYYGIDFDEPSFGPYKGIPREWAEENLKKNFPDSGIVTRYADTQKWVNTTLVREFDLVHIDADHSFNGALHDLVLFWPNCARVMVVDDYGQIPNVKMAVQVFMTNTPGAILLDTASLRGAAIIVRDQ